MSMSVPNVELRLVRKLIKRRVVGSLRRRKEKVRRKTLEASSKSPPVFVLPPPFRRLYLFTSPY